MEYFFTNMNIPGGHLRRPFSRWHFIYNQRTAYVLYVYIFTIFWSLRVFLIFVRQLLAYLIACQLMQKKQLCDSQDNDQADNIPKSFIARIKSGSYFCNSKIPNRYHAANSTVWYKIVGKIIYARFSFSQVTSSWYEATGLREMGMLLLCAYSIF